MGELLETPGVRPEAYMHFIAMAGHADLAARLAEEAEDSYEEGKLTHYGQLFFTHNQLGNTDRALYWLEKAIENREAEVITEIRHSRGFERICADPRAEPIFARLRKLENLGSPTHSMATQHPEAALSVDTSVCRDN
jgi:hypothetical protein